MNRPHRERPKSLGGTAQPRRRQTGLGGHHVRQSYPMEKERAPIRRPAPKDGPGRCFIPGRRQKREPFAPTMGTSRAVPPTQSGSCSTDSSRRIPHAQGVVLPYGKRKAASVGDASGSISGIVVSYGCDLFRRCGAVRGLPPSLNLADSGVVPLGYSRIPVLTIGRA